MPRFLTLIRIDEKNAPSTQSPEMEERMGKLFEEITKAGVILDMGGLQPTSDGTRVHWQDGKLSYTDGPFAEAKEVIGGYTIWQCKDKAEVLEWTKRFVQVHDEDWTVTVEVRQIQE
ncbi:YciI family protein [Streptomyces boluensis]|uniref:Transcriptional regulator n=1 Tax=Streptomyces boluensis TaxID=1775135 RepID=A0A964UX35_9ACTN|nr:YciI family protein [Streptomyces boluensis]NBE55888.1 transcriptional regulator [Streptomyces boluensis]